MPSERARQIEMRFYETVRLMTKKSSVVRQLAAELKVARATLQRGIPELSRCDHSIRSVNNAIGWMHELLDRYSPQIEEVSS